MATPIENAQTLIAWWQYNPTSVYSVPEAGGHLKAAQDAMAELVEQASNNPYTRLQAFAANSIFETALVAEYGGFTTQLLAQAPSNPLLMSALGGETRPPRQIMLDGIWKAGTGGWFGAQDPSGVTSWLKSVDVSAGALVGELKGDPNGEARAAALRIVRDLAIPAFWTTFLKNQRVFETLTEQLPVSGYDLSTRKALASLNEAAGARVDVAIAQAAVAGLPTLPAFPTGNGATVPTLPPAPKPWYRDGRAISAGVLGLLGGARLAYSRRS